MVILPLPGGIFERKRVPENKEAILTKSTSKPGFVVSVAKTRLGASPDRMVHDPK